MSSDLLKAWWYSKNWRRVRRKIRNSLNSRKSSPCSRSPLVRTLTVVNHFGTFDKLCPKRGVTNVSPWRASDNDEKHGWSQAASRKGRRSRSRLELPATWKYIKHVSIGLNYYMPRKSVLVVFFSKILKYKESYINYAIMDRRAGGVSLQMIRVLHRGGPANDYDVPWFWRVYARIFISADLTKNSNLFFVHVIGGRFKW